MGCSPSNEQGVSKESHPSRKVASELDWSGQLVVGLGVNSMALSDMVAVAWCVQLWILWTAAGEGGRAEAV